MNINSHQRRLVIIIGSLVGLALLLLIAGSLFNRSSVAPLFNRLVASETETMRLNGLAQKHSPDLATSRIQANVDAIVGSDLADLEAERQKTTGQAKLPKEVTTAATDAKAADDLEAAAQRDSLTAEYKRLLGGSLQTSLDLLKQLKGETKRKALESMLDRIAEHLQTLTEQVDQL